MKHAKQAPGLKLREANCLFCKIANKEISAFVVYEDENVVAFLDIEPSAPGHTMVVPKNHVVSFVDLPDGSVEPLFTAVRNLCNNIMDSLGADGATIGVNQGEAGGQFVPHLHVHIVPRFYGDGGGSLQSVVTNAPRESLEEISNKIKRQIT